MSQAPNLRRYDWMSRDRESQSGESCQSVFIVGVFAAKNLNQCNTNTLDRVILEDSINR